MIRRKHAKLVSRLVITALAVLLLETADDVIHSKGVDCSTVSQEYMDAFNRCPPLHYDRWLLFAQSNNCSLALSDYSQIYSDLAPWFSAGHLSSNYEFPPTEYVVTASFTNGSFSYNPSHIFNNIAALLPAKREFRYTMSAIDYPTVLPADDESNEPYHTMTDTMARSKCLTKAYPGHVQNMHGFFLNPYRFYTQNTLTPVFSRAKPLCYKDIMIPGEYHFQQARRFEEVEDLVPWESKQSVLFWRGSTTGGTYDDNSQWKSFHRTRLLDWEKEFSSRYPTRVCDGGIIGDCEQKREQGQMLVDVGIHTPANAEEDFIKKHIHKVYWYKTYASFERTMNFKYLLVVDGNTWPGRLQWYLGTNSVVLYNGIFVDYFMARLIPWVHYVPVALDFSDLEEKMDWLQGNDDAAHQISLNAQKLVKSINRVSAMECYVGLLLLEYSNLYSAAPR
ncbi:glycosyl transferase family 90-domain-containing protein [Obelidium mucronatum]|nr:glycosyl transferase family 90-domain-containing protein [Obelidium mucronatum]